MSLAEMGRLARTCGQREKAMEWTIQCVKLFADELPHPMAGTGLNDLTRLTVELGIGTLEQCWQRITKQPLPQKVRDLIASGMAEIGCSARAAALRLAAEHGSGLPADVEAALHTRGSAQRPEQYLDPTALAGLIVNVATLAWTIYNDRRTKTPGSSVVARKIRVHLRDVDNLGSAQRDRIIEIVIEETAQAVKRSV